MVTPLWQAWVNPGLGLQSLPPSCPLGGPSLSPPLLLRDIVRASDTLGPPEPMFWGSVYGRMRRVSRIGGGMERV